MRNRSVSNPKRRIISGVLPDVAMRELLLTRIRYVGSGHHKRNPANYGMDRVNPRPTKSLCDADGPVPLNKASGWLKEGVMKAMFSQPNESGLPKYIWCVSSGGVVYEAKTHPNTPGDYHGYPLEDEDDMKAYVMTIWEQRCNVLGN